MTQNEIEVKFKSILAMFFKCSENVFNDETNFIDDFGIDSLGVLMLVSLIEDSFGIVNGDQAQYFELVTYKKAFEYLCNNCNLQK